MKRIAIILFLAIVLATIIGIAIQWYLLPGLPEEWQSPLISIGAVIVSAIFLFAAISEITGYSLRDLSPREQPGPWPDAPYMPPRPLAEFVGREDEIRRLIRYLKPGTKTAIVGLIGMGGIGKTEIAKLAASRVARRFRDGVLWADCGLQDLANIADLWAGVYDVPLPGDDPVAKAAAWRNLVSDKESLLIFDNVQPGRSMESLFPPRGRSAVLITTRQTQHPDLRASECLTLDQFTPDEAQALVEKVLRRAVARGQTDDATHLFELVGYLPLAISVALHLADKCNWSLATLNQELEGAGALAVLGDEGALRKEEALRKSLNATFELAWDNLPDDLQGTFRTLTLFNEGASFSTQALADTLALDESQAHARLHRLAGCSLLSSVEEDRWSLHPLLREFAATRPAMEAITRARMARHYERVARAADDLYLKGGENILRGLTLFDREWPHIRAGQAWAAAHACTDDEATQLCSDYTGAAAYCLDLRLHPEEKIPWLAAAVHACRHLGDRRGQGANLGALGNAYLALGEVRQAIEYHEQALAIAREIGDRRGEGNRLGALGLAYLALGEVRQAIEYHEQALAIVREIGDRHGEGVHVGNLGNAYSALGEERRAIEYHEQALAIAREIGDRCGEGADLGNLGNAYRDLGEVRRAIEYYEQARAIAQEIGDRRNEGVWLGNLGLAYFTLGEVRRAIEYHEQALAIAQEIGDRRGEGADLSNLGNAYYDLGEVRRAIEYYEQALAISQEIGNRQGEGGVLDNLGNVYSDLGEVRRAIEYYEQALAIAQEIGDRRVEGITLGNLGLAYSELGEVRRAIEYYEQALAIAREIGDRRGEARHCWNLGLLYEESDPARAGELMSVRVAYEQEIGHPDAEEDAQYVAEIRARSHSG